MVVLPGDDKGEVRDRVSIEDLIRDYNVQLTPSGGKRLRALCPFHREKTPSFYVDVEKQYFHCFGCDEGGDIFDFVEKMDHVGFPEALEILARKAGVQLTRQRSSGPGSSGFGEKVPLFDVLSVAEEFYHRFLLDDPRGAPGRKYLEGRRIDPSMWKKFRLGFSPPGDGLFRHLTARRVSPELMERAGLIRAPQSGSGWYDYFRGRVMFPIQDPQKRVVGFGARALDDQQPKYLNTPKTAVFEKGQTLYGLPQARASIHERGRIAIMEGYTDAIMAHQMGLEHAVANLGTAFTPENARRLIKLFDHKQTPRVDMVFDGDAAGQGAAERSLDLLVTEGLDLRVYTVTHGKDPCDALLELGGEEFQRRIDAESVDIFEFKWRRTVSAAEARGEGPAGVARALDEVLLLLARVPNVVARKLQARKLAERLGLEESDLESRLKGLPTTFPPRGGAFRQRGGPSPPRGGPGVREGLADPGSNGAEGSSWGGPPARQEDGSPAGGRGSNPGGGARAGSRPDPVAAAAMGPSIEEVVLECLLAEPERARERLQGIAEDAWPFRARSAKALEDRGEAIEDVPYGLRLVAAALERQISGGVLEVRSLLSEIAEDEGRQALVRILARIDREADGVRVAHDEIWKNCLRELERKSLERRSRALEMAKVRAREEGDEAGYSALQREQLDILRRLKSPSRRAAAVGKVQQ